MRRLTHVIPSVPIKDRTVVGPFDKIERMPITVTPPVFVTSQAVGLSSTMAC